MFNLIKAAVVGLSLAVGAVGAAQANPGNDLCMGAAEVLEVVASLRDRGYSASKSLKDMEAAGINSKLAANFVALVYMQPDRDGFDIALDFYIDCMSEDA